MTPEGLVEVYIMIRDVGLSFFIRRILRHSRMLDGRRTLGQNALLLIHPQKVVDRLAKELGARTARLAVYGNDISASVTLFPTERRRPLPSIARLRGTHQLN